MVTFQQSFTLGRADAVKIIAVGCRSFGDIFHNFATNGAKVAKSERIASMRIQIINGPNLNLLGVREPEIYGSEGFDTCLSQLRAAYPEIQIDYFQSNVEGFMIDKIHEVGFSYDGIILNAGAYTHTSVALHDAIRSITTPVVELHISNVFRREAFRHHSMISPACKGVICGFGMNGYRLAIEALVDYKKQS